MYSFFVITKKTFRSRWSLFYAYQVVQRKNVFLKQFFTLTMKVWKICFCMHVFIIILFSGTRSMPQDFILLMFNTLVLGEDLILQYTTAMSLYLFSHSSHTHCPKNNLNVRMKTDPVTVCLVTHPTHTVPKIIWISAKLPSPTLLVHCSVTHPTHTFPKIIWMSA